LGNVIDAFERHRMIAPRSSGRRERLGSRPCTTCDPAALWPGPAGDWFPTDPRGGFAVVLLHVLGNVGTSFIVLPLRCEPTAIGSGFKQSRKRPGIAAGAFVLCGTAGDGVKHHYDASANSVISDAGISAAAANKSSRVRIQYGTR